MQYSDYVERQARIRGFSVEYLAHVANKLYKWGERSAGRRTRRSRQQGLDQSYITGSLALRAITTLYPWDCGAYPGYRRLAATAAGVTLSTACGWLYKNKPLPAVRAERIADYLDGRIIATQAAIRELRDYAAQRRITTPHIGRPFPKRERSANRAAD